MPHISRLFLILSCMVLGSCTHKAPLPKYDTDFPHDKNGWIKWRAQQLHTEPQAVQIQDQKMDAQHKPSNYEAPYLLEEGASLWQVHCTSCHGPKGNSNPQNWQPKPRKLGSMGLKMGFFFGGDKMRAGIFHKIKTGQSLKKTKTTPQMPAFEGALRNEQIWALVLFLENI